MRRVIGWSWKVLIVLACVAFQYLVHASVSSAQSGQFLPGLAAVSGISHAAAYLFLLWYFARTLARGREPLVTRIARSVHGPLQPGMELFTRQVTIAWCVFCATQLIASALLLAFAPLSAWSLFINLLNLPLLAAMFVGQLVYRAIRHPDFPRASVLQAIRAFTKDASRSSSAEMH
jgi:uncharacterized membrane protein